MIERQETLPGLSERELLESMGPESLVDHIVELGRRATEIENKMNEAADVLEGAYGVSVEDVMKMRESQSVVGETKSE